MTNESTDDVFAGKAPVEGLEHLGRAILDANGQPSGSPANYEALRGVGETMPTEADTARAIAQLQAEFPPVKVAQ